MKKLSIVLLAVLLIASLIISCDNSTKALTDELVEVQLGTQAGSRALSSSVTLEQISDSSLTWHYSATKTSQTEFKTGETTDKEITLGTTETFSQGKWDFELWAMKGVEKDASGIVTNPGKKVYYGNLTDVLITKSASSSPVPVVINVSPYVENVNGSVVFNNVMIKKHGTESYVEANRVSVNGTPVTLSDGDSSEISLPAGSHTAIVSYVGDDTVTYAYEEIAFTVYSGRTTTINGFVGEDTATGQITAIATAAKVQQDVSVIETETGTKESAATTFTAPVNPAGDKTQNTTVTFPLGALPVKADETELTVNLSVETKNVDSNFSASDVTAENTQVVSGIDLKVTVNGSNVTSFNEKTVEVTTYIAKGLNDVVVFYKGDALDNTAYTYNSASGALTIRTKHFSEFFVAATPFEAMNTTTNKASTLRDAITEAQNGDTIKLYNDVSSEDGYLIESKNLVLDLNDNTIKVSKGQSYNFRAIKINDSNVIIKKGTIDAQNYVNGVATPITSGTNNGAYGTVRIEGNSDVTLDTLSLYSNHHYGLSVKLYGKESNVNINNCDFYCGVGGGVEIGAGTGTITNSNMYQDGTSSSGWVSTAVAACYLGSVQVNNLGGNLVADHALYIYSSGGYIEATGGSFTAKNEKTVVQADFDAGSYGTQEGIEDFKSRHNGKASLIRINSGEFTGSYGVGKNLCAIEISGGTFDTDPSNYLAVGYSTRKVGTLFEVVPAEAMIGDNYYPDLNAAIEAASDGNTIVLLNNTSVSNTSITLQEGKTCISIQDKGITIDGNGKTITLSANEPENNTYGIYITGSDKSKTVTIKNTTINTTNLERAIRTYGSIGFKIENSTITTNGVGVHVKGANKADICDTNITVSVIDAYSAHKRAGVVVGGPDAVVTVNGCTINATNSKKTDDTNTWCKGLYVGNSAFGGSLTVDKTTVVADWSIGIDGTQNEDNPSNIPSYMTINGGDYSGRIGSPSGGDYKLLKINGGTFKGDIVASSFNGNGSKLVISGGTFNFDPSSYVDTANYNVSQNGSTWTVNKNN